MNASLDHISSQTDAIADALPDFTNRLLHWFDQHGRHDLPWQHPRTPYRVWVSEIMLQQTQVTTVIPYFERFMQRFPDVQRLGEAQLEDVLEQWQGLGYYRRARFLHQAAQQCVTEHGGQPPDDLDGWMKLPGVGRSTAGAVLSQSLNQALPILDGNVKRVFTRLAGITDWAGKSPVEKALWQLAERWLPQGSHARAADYTQALMDFGATWCSRAQPQCLLCPFHQACQARKQNLTDSIPAKAPKKQVPSQTFHVLLLHHPQHGWLLEQRAADGIWPSLFAFPMFEQSTELTDYLARYKPQAQPLAATNLDTSALKHKLTHLHMRLEPHAYRLPATCTTPQAHRTRWVHAANAATLALPKPMRSLMNRCAAFISD